MKSRSLFLGMATAVLGLSGLTAQAGQISLPSGLDHLLIPDNYAVVGDLAFSDFVYEPAPAGSPPAAAAVNVNPFTAVQGFEGLQFQGGFFTPAGTIVDYTISYKVTALTGTIDAAYLAAVGGNLFGDGFFAIEETYYALGGATLGMNSVLLGGSLTSDVSFENQTSILVQMHMFLFGGSQGATISVVNQGFSNVVPEPSAVVMMGLGLTGLLACRRSFHRSGPV